MTKTFHHPKIIMEVAMNLLADSEDLPIGLRLFKRASYAILIDTNHHVPELLHLMEHFDNPYDLIAKFLSVESRRNIVFMNRLCEKNPDFSKLIIR